jgi:nitrogen regulatory protein PII
MKSILAVIKPFTLEKVREALLAIGVQGLMVSDIKANGRQSGQTDICRGAEYPVPTPTAMRNPRSLPSARPGPGCRQVEREEHRGVRFRTGPVHKERKSMKLIIAVIKPFKLEEVREALTAIGVQGLMVSEVKGYGRQSGHTEIYRGAEYVVNFVPKIKLELIVSEAMVAKVLDTLASTAKTGKIGDGKIFVLGVDQAVRVRTGETGEEAL